MHTLQISSPVLISLQLSLVMEHTQGAVPLACEWPEAESDLTLFKSLKCLRDTEKEGNK